MPVSQKQFFAVALEERVHRLKYIPVIGFEELNKLAINSNYLGLILFVPYSSLPPFYFRLQLNGKCLDSLVDTMKCILTDTRHLYFTTNKTLDGYLIVKYNILLTRCAPSLDVTELSKHDVDGSENVI